MAKIGYARVSTEDQNLDLQISALEAAGCDRVYKEKVSAGDLRTRQSLEAALAALQPGDQLCVWKLDRLGRSVAHLVSLADDLRRKRVDLVSLTEGIDTKTPAGRMCMTMIAAMAEMEREVISERVKAGMEAAVEQGRHVGRPPKITPDKRQAARIMLESGLRLPQIASALDLSLASVKRALT
ncbi:recombinase family protein [Rhizobium leguminosarum]|uniref:recombinase family protein n=1 Tax=Rhizobium leguminosarum TaxID=384 RepID=UPI0010315615|nr:recombinase family protein [Rhizobium leguminosarum]TBE73855.1 recombinase family protein [Rhizobium leguminosarum]